MTWEIIVTAAVVQEGLPVREVKSMRMEPLNRVPQVTTELIQTALSRLLWHGWQGESARLALTVQTRAVMPSTCCGE